MSTYISNRELEELGEGLTRHFLENARVQKAARCIDIEGLANYLGMTVVFETFAEEDRDKVGFLADGRTPLKIRRKGSIVSFCFPLGTIVLDSFLRQDKESGRRHFTIAHEIAHSVIEKHNPVPQFHRIYDSEHGYTFQELKAQLTMTENQADRLAAVILMPQFTVDQALRDFNKGRRIKVVRIIPVTQTDIVFVKCRKCKFDGALSPANFRRIRNCRVNRMQWEEL
ncbi:MAG: ImmA/IrrE family metallo-endopeptidase [Lachnospiraceae bacterium]|nr:ImmA/IrrE family metallo-endopeptidase [Lachnospiraceae bacterium]